MAVELTFNEKFKPSEYIKPLNVSSVPALFDNEFYVDIDCTWSAMRNGVERISTLIIHGYLTGYGSDTVVNSIYPVLTIDDYNRTGDVPSTRIGCYLYGDNLTFRDFYIEYTREGNTQTWTDRNYGDFTNSNANYTDYKFTVNKCNIPIAMLDGSTDNEYIEYLTVNSLSFPIENRLHTYKPVTNPINDLILKRAINCAEEEQSPDGVNFEINNMWTTSTWTSDYQPAIEGIYYRNFRAKLVSGKFAFYKIDGIDDGRLKYGIKNDAVFYDMEYSTDGQTWIATDEFPYDFLFRKRERELGRFSYALTFSNNYIPEFANENDAQDYLDGLKDISDAINFDNISSRYPYANLTENEDTGTTFGEVYTRAFFSQQYICSASALQEISNAFFDTSQGGIIGIFEDIKKGLEMYGESVVDAIQGCMFFPLDLTTVFTSTQSQNYIYFGGYKFDLQNSNVNKILYPNGYKDFGSFEIVSTFGQGNIRNYAPYQRLYAYLPYIGFVELDLTKYLNKTANVRYYFDTRTGTCLACITANDILIDYFNGQCGVSMPLSMTDFSRYAQTQIQTLLSGGANMGGGGNVGEMVKSGANNFVGGLAESGAVGLGAVAVGGLAMAGAVQGAKTLYGLTQNNINNFKVTKGASSSMLNQYLPQEVLFWFEIQDDDETPYENALQGYPSNASGRIQDFDGFLAVDTVKLNCAYATDNERAEIIAYLKSGVYL